MKIVMPSTPSHTETYLKWHSVKALNGRIVHGNEIPIGIPWKMFHGMGWDGMEQHALHFPWDL